MSVALILLLPFVVTALPDGYAVPEELITHHGIDKHLCYNSKACHYDEICERVCFWREFTREFVGCKVTCVKKHPEIAEGYRSLLPLEVLKREPDYKPVHPPPAYSVSLPVYKPHPPPAYPAPLPVYKPHPPPAYPVPLPVYHPAPVPPALDEHKQACQYTKECGFGMHCNYAKVCACNKGLVPDPLYTDRCIDLHPKKLYPEPHHPAPPYHPPKPAPVYPHTCSSKYDCDYDKKCCFWRKCDAYGHCTEARQCAREC